MGWIGIQGNKHRIVTHVINNQIFVGKVVKHKKVRDGLWVLIDHPSEGNLITFVKIETKKGWVYYKTIDEYQHPYYYDCPLEFLNDAPVKSQEWRDLVISFHNKKVEKSKIVYAPKMKIALVGSRIPHITLSHKVDRSWFGHSDDGKLYKIPNKMLGMPI